MALLTVVATFLTAAEASPARIDRDGAAVAIDRTFSGNVTLAEGFTVPAGQTWSFNPDVSTTLRVEANVVVRGTLEMKPQDASITHRLVFEGIDERRFVGGGMDVLDSDVGLWVMDAGRLDLSGKHRRG